MDAIRTVDGLYELAETVEGFTELGRYAFNDEHSAYHTVVSFIHRLSLGIGLAEKAGYSRADIEDVLQPAWDLHSESPFTRRLQRWPRGYPGDYETIEYLCESVNKAQPETVGYFVEQYALTSTVAQQHRYKVAWQASKILHACLGSDEERRVLSIACGGSRDLRSVQALLKAAPVQLFLNDVDADALTYSLECLSLLEEKLHSVPGNPFSAVRAFKGLGPFDLILTGGLFDYPSDRQVKWLLAKLFGCLKVGGRLCFTNIARSNPYRAWIEYLADWKLLERSADDLLEIIHESGLEGVTHTEISTDQTGLTYLVELERIA